MSTRQSAFAGIASSDSVPLPGPHSVPIPPIPTRCYTEPLKPISLPEVHFHHSVSMSYLPTERIPPVDPRKARRHCTNFGFKRESLSVTINPSHSMPDDASLTSPEPTPPGTFSSSGSDASSLHDLQFDFPQPPPTVPVLRLMRSSPMFSLDDVESTRDKKQWAAFSIPRGHARRPSTAGGTTPWDSHVEADSLSDLGAEITISTAFSNECRETVNGPTNDLELEMQGESLMMEASDLGFDHWPGGFSDDTSARGTLPSASKSSFTLEPDPNKFHSSHSPGHFTTIPPPPPPLPPLPSSDFLSPAHRQVLKMRSLKFAPGCNSSLERLDVSMEKPKPRGSLFRGRSISMDFHRRRSSSVIDAELLTGHTQNDALSSYLPDLRSVSDRNLKSHRSTGNSFNLQSNRDRPAGLSTPFLHRPVRNIPIRPYCSHPSSSAPSPALKSFIEITPEPSHRKGVAGHREKVRKLLTRASQVFDLKNLRKKGSL